MDCSHEAPLPIEFSRQEYWSRFSFPSPGDLPNPGTEPVSPSFDSVDHNKLRKFLKRFKYQTPLPISSETCMQVKKQWLEHYMEWLTGFKFGKEYDKAVYSTWFI